MRKLYFASLLSLLCLTIGGIIWTQDLQQINEETIFLTSEGKKEYLNFQNNFNIKSIVIGKADLSDRESFFKTLNSFCPEVCEIIDSSQLPENSKIKLKNNDEEAFLIVQSEDSTKAQFKETIKKIIASDRGSVIEFSGVPYTNILLDRYSDKIKSIIFPSLFGGVFFLLILFFRSLLLAIVIFIPGLMASSFALVCTKYFLNTSNLITSIIPLLLFVIQLSLVLHIHYTAIELKDLKASLIDKLAPVLLMVLTTFIGFGSLFFSDLTAISNFGVLTAFLLIGVTILTYCWMWSLACALPHLWTQSTKGNYLDSISIENNLNQFWGHRLIIIFSVTALALGSYSLYKIPIVTDATKYFPESTKLREKMVALANDFIGTPILEMIVPLGNEEKLYDNLLGLELKEEALSLKLKGALLSSNQLVKIGNKAYTGNDYLPDNKFAYYALRSKAPFLLKEGYPIDNSYRITLLSPPVDSDAYEKILLHVKTIFGDDVKFNGIYYHLMAAQKKMIGTLFMSFSLSLLLISFLAFLYYKNIKIFFIFIAVNIIPVFTSFPLLWLFGLSFNIATVMTYSISLGLVVDSSFHIIHAMNSTNKSPDYLTKAVLKPILGASLLLSFCFFLFSLIDFIPIKEFGISLGTIILLGMLFDLKVLPTLYSKKK